ncbi:transcription termination factor Rho [Pedococcus sp. KACC 23699]
MKVAELQGLAASMGIAGTAKMRKGDLVAAIKDRQSGGSAPRREAAAEERPAAESPRSEPARTESARTEPARTEPANTGSARSESLRAGSATTEPADAGSQRTDSQPQEASTTEAPRTESPRAGAEQARAERQRARAERAARAAERRAERPQTETPADRGEAERSQDRDDRVRSERGDGQQNRADRSTERDERGQSERSTRGDRQQGERDDRNDRNDRNDRQQGDRNARGDRSEREERDDRQHDRGTQGGNQHQGGQNPNHRAQNQGGQNQGGQNQGGQNQGGQNQGQQDQGYGDEDGDGRGRRRNRNRSRNRDKRGRTDRQYGGDYESEPQVAEDDVLIPVAGILDVLENYAFVRTSGYLPGNNDVYVPLGTVKKNGMRKGDAITGAVKAQVEDQQQSQRQKFNALVRLDTVNGMTPDEARKRVEFGKLTPLYPQQRLRLETEAGLLTTRVIDLVAPIGKGQRGLIVAPAKAGKTMVMQAIANAITTNNPECHLMVVLVDERPEEVTDMQRAVKGEVISSTFDRPAEDHTTVAELAIERAKRLVEMGHDVVVLLDSITKLGRAYNLAAPASGRILSGGVDSAALYPPKKFFGAARNIEDGGSLTILATALVETGSRMDEVIFEEFKGTGNMELKLDRGLSNRRIFPAVDINNSGTRKEELLLSGEELKIMWKLRRVLAALDQQQGIELLIDRLKKTKSNVEFLMQVQQNSSLKPHDENS